LEFRNILDEIHTKELLNLRHHWLAPHAHSFVLGTIVINIGDT
jgi:hypothetical protein